MITELVLRGYRPRGRRLWIAAFFILQFSVIACGDTSVPPETVEATPVSTVTIESTEGIPAIVREQLSQSNGGYFILRFEGLPLDQDTESKLKAGNVLLFDYVPESAYYAYLPPESLPILEKLVQAGILRQVSPIPSSGKLEAGLQAKVQADPQQEIAVIVQFFQEPSAAEQKALEEWLEVSAYSFGPVNFAEGTAMAKDLERIVSLPFVKWVEEQPENELSDG